MAVTVAGFVESLRTDISDPMTWSHNSGTTAPKGVLVAIIHGTSSTDHVLTVTYGGVSMTRVQRNVDTATEPGAAEWWALMGTPAAAIPTGTQTVSADLSSATTDDIHGVSITLNANQYLEVVDTDGTSDQNQANPSVTLQYGSRSGMSFGALYSGLSTTASLAAGTNCTFFTTSELAGNFTSGCIRQTTGGTADFTIAWSTGADDVAYAAVAVCEISPTPFINYQFPSTGDGMWVSK